MDTVALALEQKLGDLFDDADFNTVHRRMSPFNLFEAVGAVRAELRHSNFLAYLLSPSRPHGLGPLPLIAVLRSILSRIPSNERPIMALELVAGDLDDAIVYRERDDIDIIVELPSLNFVVAIENKVGSKAGDGQLERYDVRLKKIYPDHRRLMVFLTPEGTTPDHAGYVAYDYGGIVETLESIITNPLEPLPSETVLIINHYIDLVRKHIVTDERLRSLAVRLYERHREAFDFIYNCRPEPRNLLAVVRERIESVEGLTIESTGSNILRFTPDVWDTELQLVKADPTKWTKTGRGLLFEVKTYPNTPGRVNLSLILGPCDSAMRSYVYQAAMANPKLFQGVVKPMGVQFATIFSRDLLTATQATGMSFEGQETNVSLAWSSFQSEQLQHLMYAILEMDQQLVERQKPEIA